MPDLTPVAAARQRAEDANTRLLHDRVTAAFGNHYLIGEEIGRGGMAVVYSATDVRLQRVVALKVLPPDLAFRADVRERFVREAQTSARLNHPHIVPIYAVHEDAGMVCFAMGLVHGESLAQRIGRETRPSFEYIGTVLEQTADALAYAHACGVVHRDIKPDNILLDRDSGRVMVTDFGIARAAESGSRLTQTGIAVGTPAFMSPEQATGEREIDGRSDVYSLGVVGYLMLAGRLPFEAATTPAMLVKHVSETPPPIWKARPDAPAMLVDILERCLAKRPDDRWENALALRDALRHAVRSGFGAKASGGGYAPGRHLAVESPSASRRDARQNGEAGRAARGESAAPQDARRFGNHHDDWAPRPVAAPERARGAGEPARPATRAPMAMMPPLPPYPMGGSKREIREWERASREQRKEMKERWKLERQVARDTMNDANGLTPEERISRFRTRLVTNGALMGFLVVINASTTDFPWAIFPVFGMSMGIIGDYARLRSRGIRWGHIFGSRTLGDAAPVVDALPKPTRIAQTVQAFRSHFRWAAGSAAVSAVSLAVGASTGADPLIVPFVGAGMVAAISSIYTVRDWFRLRAFGITARAALGDGWQARAASSDDRPREVRMREDLLRIAGDSVLSSRFGDAVRDAIEDRQTIRETSARLTDADRQLVPDVEPTADALLERIGALATGLDRLERDLGGEALPQLDARIVATEGEPAHAPDRERRLSLLRRQRASLADLAERRSTMQRQLESASLALRSLRLDMVKLRTLGVGAAIGDVNNATQEARALSRDIGRAVEVADEVRKI